LSDDAETGDEVEEAARALDSMISAQLSAGGNRCVLAAACVWGGVKEMSEITSSQSAAAVRTIADEIDPPSDVPRPRTAAPSDDVLMAAVREQGWIRGVSKQKPSDELAQSNFNQEIASDVIGEAIDLIDQAQPGMARALLMALRGRLIASPRQPSAAARRRWGA
jgi:hypothetical protein